MSGKKLLYEISTRSWIRQFGEKATLSDVPNTRWKDLADQGFEFIWLMGVWRTTAASIDEFCFHPNLTKSYEKVNPNWEREDVWGSPYAVDDYVLHDRLGSHEDLKKVHKEINEVGMKLILDFVPNHFNAFSKVAQAHPMCFVQGSQKDLERDPDTYYSFAEHIFAHGRDPYFPAWTDTIQVNYAQGEAHDLMVRKLHEVADLCDGVRCDMAMLMLPDIFSQTWSCEVKSHLHFWRHSIAELKRNRDFVFIAESYWDRESELQSLGFDFTYDKRLLDLLQADDRAGLSRHSEGDPSWHRRSVKFVENHDEDRSLETLGFERSRAAATIMMTMPGLSLVFDGQLEGYRKRVPVQLALDSLEIQCPCTIIKSEKSGCACQGLFYQQLLKALKHTAFGGNWNRIPSESDGVLTWTWTHEDAKVLVVVNYTYETVEVNAPRPIGKDILNQVNTLDERRNQDGVAPVITLPPFRSAIFEMDH